MRQLASWCIAVSLIAGCGKVASEEVAPEVDAGPDAPMPPPGEICTPSIRGSVPVDDNGNGETDEGCAWNFGTPHWLPPAAGVPWEVNLVTPTSISADGLRLYLAHSANFPEPYEILVQTRPSRDAAFGAPTKVTSPDFVELSVSGITFSQDELEAFVEARPVANATTGTDLYRLTRGDRGKPLGGIQKLAALSTADNDERPFLRADGRELLWASGRKLKRALRATPADAFGPVETVVLSAIPADRDVNNAYLTPDGHTLFFYGNFVGRYRIYRSHRDDVDSATFSAPEEVVALESSGAQQIFSPVVSVATREIFFGSDQPWSPGRYGVWRAQICRQGACENETIACPGGVRSPDNLHCYVSPANADIEAKLERQCANAGGHLADVHSKAEHDLIWTTYGNQALWIGGFDERGDVAECNTGISKPLRCVWGWESGTRWTFSNWGSNPAADIVEPQSAAEDCVVMYPDAPYGGTWADITCTNPARGACETVLYPTW